MEITKESIFKIKYNSKKDVIELADKKNNLKIFLKKNKFILSIIGTTTFLVVLNICLINQFYIMLGTI